MTLLERLNTNVQLRPFATSRTSIMAMCLLLAGCMLLASTFVLFKQTAFFDDSFIYLHIAANIAQEGTARYFPIAHVSLLLASSPLHLLTLVPGFLALEALHIPIRTIQAARFDFLSGGIVTLLCFLPFWLNRIPAYLLLASAFFLLAASLDTILTMEGGALFISLATFASLLADRPAKPYSLGVVLLLVGLCRPEIGVIALLVTFAVYAAKPSSLLQIILGTLFAFIVYSALMLALGVYPIPSTIWSKELTGRLHLFTHQNFLQTLPVSIGSLIGLTSPPAFWLLMGSPLGLSLSMGRTVVPVLLAIGSALSVALAMPGNFAWYGQNFLLAWLVLMGALAVEAKQRQKLLTTLLFAALALGVATMTLLLNFGKNKDYPWNVGSPLYETYRAIGADSIGDGRYLIEAYAKKPVRIRMCEIGIVSYFSGPDSWIDDLCGLAQIGNLSGAQTSWLRYLYPPSFVENGDQQMAKLPHHSTTPVIDVWGLPSKQAAAEARSKCQFVGAGMCINAYK